MIKTLAPPKATQLTLLMIQDEYSVSPVLRQMLELERIQIRTVANGLEALNLLDNLTPQLILADLDLPGLNGLDLLSQIKAQLPQTPIIFLSALMTESEILRGLELGAEDYLLKPARPVQVLTRIRKLLARLDAQESGFADFTSFASRLPAPVQDLPYPWSLETVNRSGLGLFHPHRDSA